MKSFFFKIFRIVITALFALVSTLLLFLCTLYIHLKIYSFYHPNDIMEIDHNVHLEDQVTLHFKIAIPLLYGLSYWLLWRVFNKRCIKVKNEG